VLDWLVWEFWGGSFEQNLKKFRFNFFKNKINEAPVGLGLEALFLCRVTQPNLSEETQHLATFNLRLRGFVGKVYNCKMV
jgi:hypothetical protein